MAPERAPFDRPVPSGPDALGPSARSAMIDLNADLGEHGSAGTSADAAMLDLVTTANIACGGHAGDPTTMRTAASAAAERRVAITAHVSYPDRDRFGREFMDLPSAELTDQVIAQTESLLSLAGKAGAEVRGVKPHGALYNALAHHQQQADAVVTALLELGEQLALIAAPGSVVARRARAAGVRVVFEGFADRAYAPDGTLVPRSRPGAVLTDPGAVALQALSIAAEGTVRSIDGTRIEIDCRTLCLHGDTPGALALGRAVRSRLEAEGIAVRAAL